MKNLIIIGAGGLGREMTAWVEGSLGCGEDWILKGYLDDNLGAFAGYDVPYPILGTIGGYEIEAGDVFCCAIGTPSIKRKCVEAVLAKGGEFISVIHKTAIIGHRNQIGQGFIACPLAIVTSDVTIGDFVTVNVHSSVDHDAKIGDFSQLHCHVDITGGVTLGEEVLCGSKSSVLPGVVVGDRVVVGAGSVVTRNAPDDVTLVGIPARPLRR